MPGTVHHSCAEMRGVEDARQAAQAPARPGHRRAMRHESLVFAIPWLVGLVGTVPESTLYSKNLASDHVALHIQWLYAEWKAGKHWWQMVFLLLKNNSTYNVGSKWRLGEADVDRVRCIGMINMGHGQVGQGVLRRNKSRAGSSKLHQMYYWCWACWWSCLNLMPSLEFPLTNSSQKRDWNKIMKNHLRAGSKEGEMWRWRGSSLELGLKRPQLQTLLKPLHSPAFACPLWYCMKAEFSLITNAFEEKGK